MKVTWVLLVVSNAVLMKKDEICFVIVQHYHVLNKRPVSVHTFMFSRAAVPYTHSYRAAGGNALTRWKIRKRQKLGKENEINQTRTTKEKKMNLNRTKKRIIKIRGH